MYEEPTIMTFVRLPVSLRERLNEWARNEKRSTSSQIALICEQAVEQHERSRATQDPKAPYVTKSKKAA